MPSNNPGLFSRLKNRVFRVLRTPLAVRFQWAYNGPRTVNLLVVNCAQYYRHCSRPQLTFGVSTVKPSRRSSVNKRRSARQFKGNIAHTKSINLSPGPMRGGIRL